MNTTPKIKPKSVYRKDRHNRVSIRLKGYDYSRAGLYFITICCHHKVPRFGVVVNGKMELNEFGKIAYAEWLKLSERFSNVELDAFQIMPDHMHGIILLKNPPVGAGFTPAPPAPPAPPSKLNPMQPDDPTATSDLAALAMVDSRATARVAPTAMVDTTATAMVDSAASAMVDSAASAMVDSRATARVAPTTMVDSTATAMVDLAASAMVDSTATARVAPITVGGIVGAYKSMVSNRCLDIYKFKNETMGQFWQRNYYEHIIRTKQSYQRISKYIINNPLKWTKDKFYTK
jgi:REP element-mobilizing transposase RayT